MLVVVYKLYISSYRTWPTLLLALYKIYSPLSILRSEIQFWLGCDFNYNLGKGLILFNGRYMIQFCTKTCKKKSDRGLWERFFLYVTTEKCPKKATCPSPLPFPTFGPDEQRLTQRWCRDLSTMRGMPQASRRTSESLGQLPPYGCYLTEAAKPSQLAVTPPSPHWTHTLRPAPRGKMGSVFYFPSPLKGPLKGWFCILLSPTEYDGNDTTPVQGLVSKGTSSLRNESPG